MTPTSLSRALVSLEALSTVDRVTVTRSSDTPNKYTYVYTVHFWGEVTGDMNIPEITVPSGSFARRLIAARARILQDFWLLVDAVKNFFACGGQEGLCHSARWPWTCWLTRRRVLRPTFGRYGCSSSSPSHFSVFELVAMHWVAACGCGSRYAQRAWR